MPPTRPSPGVNGVSPFGFSLRFFFFGVNPGFEKVSGFWAWAQDASHNGWESFDVTP